MEEENAFAWIPFYEEFADKLLEFKDNRAELLARLKNVYYSVQRLNDAIEEDDSLGRGFCIGHSYFCDIDEDNVDSRLDEIIEYEIVPLLNEYWFDADEKAQRWTQDLRDAIR